MASVGKHIKHLRTARNMTQEQLAERLFVTRQAVSAWETEKALPDVAERFTKETTTRRFCVA